MPKFVTNVDKTGRLLLFRFYLLNALLSVAYTGYFLEYSQLTQADGMLVLAIGLIAGGLLEIPMGLWVDRRGVLKGLRASSWCFLIHSIFYATSAVFFLQKISVSSALPTHFAAVLAVGGEIALAIATTLGQVSLNAWLVPNLHEHGYNDGMPKIFGRGRLVRNFARMITGVILLPHETVPNVVQLTYLSIVLIYVGVLCVTYQISAGPNVLPTPGDSTVETKPAEYMTTLRAAFINIWRDPLLRYIFVAFSFSYLIGVIFLYYWKDIFRHFVPDEILGAITGQDLKDIFTEFWIPMNFARMAGNLIVQRISKSTTRPKWILQISMVLLSITPLMLFGIDLGYDHASQVQFKILLWIGFGLCLQQLMQEITMPLIYGWLHDHVTDEHHRATTESILATGPGLLMFLVIPFYDVGKPHLIIWGTALFALILLAVTFIPFSRKPVEQAPQAS